MRLAAASPEAPAMIIGIGTDLLDIRRIERTLDRFGERFLERIFTEAERRRCEARVRRAGAYAQRFAAKEACAKALGTGFRQNVFWRDIEIRSLPSGKPELYLSGGALLRLQALLPAGTGGAIDVSMTDDYPWAQAVVVISVPGPGVHERAAP